MRKEQRAAYTSVLDHGICLSCQYLRSRFGRIPPVHIIRRERAATIAHRQGTRPDQPTCCHGPHQGLSDT